MQLCCQMCEIARVCSHPLTHGMQIKGPPLPFLPLTNYALVFSNYCHQMGALRLWQHVKVSWIETTWTGGSRWLMWRSLTPAETDPQRTAWQPILQPENPNVCVYTVQSFPTLLPYSQSLPGGFPPPERSLLWTTHISTRRASSILEWTNSYMPRTMGRWDAVLHWHFYRRSIVILIDCVQTSITVQCSQWKRTGQILWGSSGLARTNADTAQITSLWNMHVLLCEGKMLQN